jgi:hypothetical protein
VAAQKQLAGFDLLMKINEVRDRKRDYYSNQTKAEDVSDIVAGYASTSAFGILLIGAGSPVGLFILRC